MKIKNFSEIAEYLLDKKFNKIFLITGKNSYFLSGADKIFDEILKQKISQRYFKRELIPKFKELKEILQIIKNFQPDLILAVGGGTVIDYAKCVNSLEYDVDEESIKLGEIKFKKKAHLCAIPTTAGSGAEVTENAVIYLNNIKYSIEDRKSVV